MLKSNQTKSQNLLSQVDVQTLRGCVAELNNIRYLLMSERVVLLEQSNINDDDDLRYSVTLTEKADADLLKATNHLVEILTLLSKRVPDQKTGAFEFIRKLIKL
jgi:hypothetical protein